MESLSTLPRWAAYWLLFAPYHLLRLLLADGAEDAWAEYEDDILVVQDALGRETYLLSDALAERQDPAAPLVPWRLKKWAAIDEAMEAPFAWTPVTDGVRHALILRRTLGAAVGGFSPAPAICDSG